LAAVHSKTLAVSSTICAHRAQIVPKRSLRDLHTNGESGVIQSKPIRSVTVVVDLDHTKSDVLFGHDIEAAAELTRPTVVSSAHSMDVTASEQSVNEWFELVIAFGEAGSYQVSKVAPLDSINLLGSKRQVAFNGPPLRKINGGRYGKAEQITTSGRSLSSIDGTPQGHVKFGVILRETRTRTKKQQA